MAIGAINQGSLAVASAGGPQQQGGCPACNGQQQGIPDDFKMMLGAKGSGGGGIASA